MPTKEFRLCLAPFQEYHSSGPFYDKNNDRMLIHLLKKGFPSRTLSYPRYLFSVKTGVEPPSGYEIDHIDGNRRNDRIENLQLLTKSANSTKSHNDPRALAQKNQCRLVCPKCEKEFFRKESSTFLCKGKSDTAGVTFCSRRCSYSWRDFVGFKQEIQKVAQEEVREDRSSESWEKWSTPWIKEISGSLVNVGKPRKLLREQEELCKHCGATFYKKYQTQEYCSKRCVAQTQGASLRRVSDNQVNAALDKVFLDGVPWSRACIPLGISDNALRKHAKRLGRS